MFRYFQLLICFLYFSVLYPQGQGREVEHTVCFNVLSRLVEVGISCTIITLNLLLVLSWRFTGNMANAEIPGFAANRCFCYAVAMVNSKRNYAGSIEIDGYISSSSCQGYLQGKQLPLNYAFQTPGIIATFCHLRVPRHSWKPRGGGGSASHLAQEPSQKPCKTEKLTLCNTRS